VTLDSSDITSSILSLDGSILNDTSLKSFTVEVSAATDSFVPLNISFNFNMSRVITEQLNILPQPVVMINDVYAIPVNFDIEMENYELPFSFIDANNHYMNITLDGMEDMIKFAEFIDYP
jgi:hypothetical protein